MSPAADQSRLRSCIYEGRVTHRRTAPIPHAFTYSLFLMYLDLDELPRVFAGSRLWRVERPAVASFRRSDFLGDPAVPLAQAVRDLVAARSDARPDGPVRLLTSLRYFGHSFNPVSFYYCFAKDGETLVAIVAEITNTPWRERHAYVLHVRDPQQSLHRFAMPKVFHISPFMGMVQDYGWRFTAPAERLAVHMENREQGDRMFSAALTMQRRRITPSVLARMLVRYPALTLKVLAGIYLQAAALWWKGLPFFSNPRSLPPLAKAPA
ncbi:MAG: DUF1365 domain-containing protein [Planctomycetes bacterium]|nr:DUF1365 domain-containing protein [Planctomycetota bacterium]